MLLAISFLHMVPTTFTMTPTGPVACMPQAFLLALASAVGQAAASRIAPHKGFDVGSRAGAAAIGLESPSPVPLAL